MAIKRGCVCACVCIKSTGTSFYLPSYGGGGGIVRPLGRGMVQYSGASAPSEVSVESSSLSYRSASRSARTDDVSAPPIGRGLPVARGQYLLSQTTGIGEDFVLWLTAAYCLEYSHEYASQFCNFSCPCVISLSAVRDRFCRLVAWHSGRMLVFGRCAFPVLRLTCS